MREMRRDDATLRMVELFAGVGGFRVALEPLGWRTVWANQWEPGTGKQHAFQCYVNQFMPAGIADEKLSQVHDADSIAVNKDIELVLDEIAEGSRPPIPRHDLLVAGFPCQDFSVAKTRSKARGLRGKKGVLWWSIHEVLSSNTRRPKWVFLENVDRLLKSPANRRGRDFAIMLSCLTELGYLVEWRVVNAADYGFPQRRRRVYIVCSRPRTFSERRALAWLTKEGVLAAALPVAPPEQELSSVDLLANTTEVSRRFGKPDAKSPFQSAGVAFGRAAWTIPLSADWQGAIETLGSVLEEDEGAIAPEFFIPTSQIRAWRDLKAAKSTWRRAASGFEYFYSEGSMEFPDPVDRPARTILTGEGGSSPSRFKHVVSTGKGKLRRLTPLELERLNGFPENWTAAMKPRMRAFVMGNALVVGLVRMIGEELTKRVKE